MGQEDDLTCAGLSIDDRLLTTLAGWTRDGKFQPIPTVSVERRIVDGCPLAVLSVTPSTNTPVRYEGKTLIRVGPRSGLASAEEERTLTERRFAASLPFDARGVPDATLQDLDETLFVTEYLRVAVPREVIAQNSRTLAQQMRALRFLDAQGHPTAAAILIVGTSPEDFFPGAFVQCLRIAGRKLTDPIIDQHRLSGTLAVQGRLMDEIATVWNRTASVIGGQTRQDFSDYPLEALRQLMRNAIIHRNYDGTNAPVKVHWFEDRIEIHSPGGLYGSVTPKTFGAPGVTDYRNPTIVEALRALGFVERFGVGQIGRAHV